MKRTRRVCYHCALPINEPLMQACPRCGGADIDERRSRPSKTTKLRTDPLPHPWGRVEFDAGGTLLLSGNAGSGKTTICLAARPTRIITSEQQNQQVASIWYRVHPELPAPIISTCDSVEELAEDLSQVAEGEMALMDSVSQLKLGMESGKVLEDAIEHIRSVGARAMFIAQFTKDGKMLGPNELRHLVDVVATIPNDPMGLRRLSVEKNRFGDLSSTYFSIGSQGVSGQNFRWAYSVEGGAGNYNLHLFPQGGAKLSGIYTVLEEMGISGIKGTASAAIACKAYEEGFVEPDDVDRRRMFAEDHGLTWLSATEARSRIEEALTTRSEP